MEPLPLRLSIYAHRQIEMHPIPYLLGDGVSTLRKLLVAYLQKNIDCPVSFNIPDEDYPKIFDSGKKYRRF